MPVAHVIRIVHLDQLNRRQRFVAQESPCNPQPAVAGLFSERVELVIKIISAGFGAADLYNFDNLFAGIMAGSQGAFFVVFAQLRQAVRAAGDKG